MADPPEQNPLIHFGQSHTGNVGFGDVVGGDKITNVYQALPAPAAPAFQVPYPPNPLFRGRDAELQQLADALLGEVGGAVAVLPAISGTGGIGKTQLASDFAHRHRAAFPGGVFWLSMEQPELIASQVAAAAGGPGGLDLPG